MKIAIGMGLQHWFLFWPLVFGTSLPSKEFGKRQALIRDVLVSPNWLIGLHYLVLTFAELLHFSNGDYRLFRKVAPLI